MFTQSLGMGSIGIIHTIHMQYASIYILYKRMVDRPGIA